MLRFVPLLGLVLAGCAAPSGVAVAPPHPASASAPAAPLVVSATPLAPAPEPDLPAALRPSPHERSGHDRAGMDHGAMAGEPMAPADDAPLRPVLDAYLAVHDALAADRLAPEAAAALAETVTAWTATAPPDDPHLWHREANAVTTVRRSVAALAEAADLGAARAAFGALSVPLAALVEANGGPGGYGLDRFTCGMADAPHGGVWLQPAGDAQNPYFGTSMAMCGTRDAAGPSAAGAEMQHDGLEAHR